MNENMFPQSVYSLHKCILLVLRDPVLCQILKLTIVSKINKSTAPTWSSMECPVKVKRQTFIKQSYKSVLSTREENMVLYKDVKEETHLVRGKVIELYRAESCDEGFLFSMLDIGHCIYVPF